MPDGTPWPFGMRVLSSHGRVSAKSDRTQVSTILVTAIGSFSADIAIKRLHELGHRVIGCDIYPAEWVVDSLNVDAFYQAPLASDAEAYAAFVDDVCEREGVRWVMPSTDVEVDFFNTHRDVWPDRGAVCISSASTLSICRDKARTAAFLKGSKSGVIGIPTVSLSRVGDEWPGYPVVAKPLDGRSSSGLHRIHTDAEWRAALDEISNPGRYLVQPLVEGVVVTVDVVRDVVGSPVVAVPREELLRTLNGAGTSVHVFHDDALVTSCARLADELGVLGCVNFEFIRDEDGAYHFLECNPRLSGGVEFTCMAAYDCIGNLLRAFEGESIEPLGSYEDQFIARKYEEYVMKVGA